MCVDDPGIRPIYAGCKAFILPAKEDFGVTSLETMASGHPVIAYGRGGVFNTVVPGLTGQFSQQQTAESLMEVLAAFDPADFDPQAIRTYVQRFDNATFSTRLATFIDNEFSRRF